MSKPNFYDDLKKMKSGATEIFHSIPYQKITADKLTDEQMTAGINIQTVIHLNCVRQGHKILIDTYGVWCSKCEPNDYKEKA